MTSEEYAVVGAETQHAAFAQKALLNHLDLELTERCNNSCLHCYINLPADDMEAKRRELTTRELQRILAESAELGALSVRFTGGEPLLRPDFPEIYVFARRLGLRVILFTNGRLITPELADLFARIPPLMKIEVSTYGMRVSSYDAVARARGAFAQFRRGLELLEERRVPFMVKSILLPQNMAELDELEAWVATLPGGEKGSLSHSGLLDMRTRRDSSARNSQIARLRCSPDQAVGLAERAGETYRTDMARFSTRFMHPQGDELFSCGAGKTGCVDAYGNYQMCMLLRHPDTVYDLRSGTLREALTEFFPLTRELRATDPTYLERCARCFLKGLCEQCPAKSWAEHGTLDTPVEYLCDVAHAQARYLGLLREGERAWRVSDWQDRLAAFASTDEARGPR